jgi:hypothetical protein
MLNRLIGLFQYQALREKIERAFTELASKLGLKGGATEAKRLRRGGSGGGIAHALNLKGRPAFNEYRPALRAHMSDAEIAVETRRNRNAAKARRQALRAHQ